MHHAFFALRIHGLSRPAAVRPTALAIFCAWSGSDKVSGGDSALCDLQIMGPTLA